MSFSSPARYRFADRSQPFKRSRFALLHPVSAVSPSLPVCVASLVTPKLTQSVSVLAADRTSFTYLIPGTYTSSSSLTISSLTFTSSTNESITSSSDQLVISSPPYPITFPSIDFLGSSSIWTPSSWKSSVWKSVHLPEGWYGVLSPGQVLWGAIPDSSQLASELSSSTFIKAASCMFSFP